MEPRASESSSSKRPRMGVIVRVLIYVPLLGFFGWRAIDKYLGEREAADDNFRASVEQWLQHPPRTIVMPNGEVMPVLELSEEEAAEMGLLPLPTTPQAEASAKPEPEPPAPPAPPAETAGPDGPDGPDEIEAPTTAQPPDALEPQPNPNPEPPPAPEPE